MEQEIWKLLPGSAGCYSISNYGKVKREISITAAKAGKEMKQHVSRDGYMQVGISIKGKGKLLRIHRAVFETFCGEIPTGLVINHKDGNKQNNYVENLEAISNRDNILHAFRVLKRAPSGRKVTEDQVIEIRKRHSNGVKMRVLANEYGIKFITVANIVRGRTWKLTGGPTRNARYVSQTQQDVMKRISDEQAAEFVQRYHNGESAAKLAEEAGIHVRSMYNWIEGKSRTLPNNISKFRNNPMLPVPGTMRVPPKRHEFRSFTKLTKETVIKIREDRAAGLSVAVTAKKYGVSWSQAFAIVTGAAWRHVGGPITDTKNPRASTSEIKQRIVNAIGEDAFNDFINGTYPINDLARKLGVAAKTTRNWKRYIKTRK